MNRKILVGHWQTGGSRKMCFLSIENVENIMTLWKDLSADKAAIELRQESVDKEMQ